MARLNDSVLNGSMAMNTTSRNLLPCLLFALSELWLNAASPSTAFTYQGRLLDNGVAANGLYDLQFTNYDAATGGNALSAFNPSSDRNLKEHLDAVNSREILDRVSSLAHFIQPPK
jgi:hypothetical protein